MLGLGCAPSVAGGQQATTAAEDLRHVPAPIVDAVDVVVEGGEGAGQGGEVVAPGRQRPHDRASMVTSAGQSSSP